MSGERAVTLPEDLDDWLDAEAEARGVDRSELLAQAVAAYRLVEEADDLPRTAPNGVGPTDEAADRLDALLDRVSTLDGRVAAVEDDLDEKITDVRERVIQVKRETDAKAPTDHDHPDLRDRLERTADALDDVEESVSALGRRVDAGFENYEEVLRYFKGETEELEARTDALARVLLDVRDSVAELERVAAEREALADLTAAANRADESTAKCEQCESKVHVGLLATPHCPHCDSTFTDLDPAAGLFGSARLRTGTRPALDGESGVPESPSDLFETDTDE